LKGFKIQGESQIMQTIHTIRICGDLKGHYSHESECELQTEAHDNSCEEDLVLQEQDLAAPEKAPQERAPIDETRLVTAA